MGVIYYYYFFIFTSYFRIKMEIFYRYVITYRPLKYCMVNGYHKPLLYYYCDEVKIDVICDILNNYSLILQWRYVILFVLLKKKKKRNRITFIFIFKRALTWTRVTLGEDRAVFVLPHYLSEQDKRQWISISVIWVECTIFNIKLIKLIDKTDKFKTIEANC